MRKVFVPSSKFEIAIKFLQGAREKKVNKEDVCVCVCFAVIKVNKIKFFRQLHHESFHTIFIYCYNQRGSEDVKAISSKKSIPVMYGKWFLTLNLFMNRAKFFFVDIEEMSLSKMFHNSHDNLLVTRAKFL